MSISAEFCRFVERVDRIEQRMEVIGEKICRLDERITVLMENMIARMDKMAETDKAIAKMVVSASFLAPPSDEVPAGERFESAGKPK
jgi:hypothetical protein